MLQSDKLLRKVCVRKIWEGFFEENNTSNLPHLFKSGVNLSYTYTFKLEWAKLYKIPILQIHYCNYDVLGI